MVPPEEVVPVEVTDAVPVVEFGIPARSFPVVPWLGDTRSVTIIVMFAYITFPIPGAIEAPGTTGEWTDRYRYFFEPFLVWCVNPPAQSPSTFIS